MTTNTIILIALAVTVADQSSTRKPPKVYYSESLPFGQNAMTVPPIGIFIKESQCNNEQLLEHELIHWDQYCDRGTIMFYMDYLLGLLHNGYDLHPMEIQARVNENQYAKYNYTHAVRTGVSNTIYDPNFRI